MRLGKIRIVDMRRSGIPEEQWQITQETFHVSPPEDWHVIRKYVPYDYKENAAIRPDYKFVWNNNTPKAISDWQIKWKYSLVKPEDGYWPEGIIPSSDGTYVFGDLVLMKIYLLDWIEKRKAEIGDREIRLRAEERRFTKEAKRMGADVSDDELQGIVGELTGL